MTGRHVSSLGGVLLLAALAASTALARPSAAPTLTASSSSVVFGKSIVLKGAVPGASAGQEVQILAQGCGFTGAVPIATAKTSAGGAYSFTFEPMLNSLLSVESGSSVSRTIRLTIKPLVELRRVSARAFAVDVSAGNGGYFSKAALLQARSPHTKSWRTIGTAKLKPASDPGDIVAVSSGTFHVAVRPGTTVRAAVTRATVGECYLPAASAPTTT